MDIRQVRIHVAVNYDPLNEQQRTLGTNLNINFASHLHSGVAGSDGGLSRVDNRTQQPKDAKYAEPELSARKAGLLLGNLCGAPLLAILIVLPVGWFLAIQMLIGAIENRPTWIIRRRLPRTLWIAIYVSGLAAGILAAQWVAACQNG